MAKSAAKHTENKTEESRAGAQDKSQEKRIKLAILWHQHQPYYRAGDRFVLPWVWLHATKDYLEMAQHLERHPAVHATINLVPSLLKQIEEYLEQLAVDPVVQLMTKPTDRLSELEKVFILDHFFLANPRVISRSPRYKELHDQVFGELNASAARSARLSEQDYRDLAIHYSLAWTGEIARRAEPFRSFIERDRNFSEEDKQALMAAQMENVRAIIPLHKKLARKGQVELTTTPFYHPILPLLTDIHSAREAMPDVSLPREEFAYPEEADAQLRLGREYFEEVFGFAPAGLWPSEGSVSEAALSLAAKNGFSWAATDEGVLARSIGDLHLSINGTMIQKQDAKYFPWIFESGSHHITIFFRDHRLSDNIGFTYQSWRAEDAVQDFIASIERIRLSLIEHYGEEILDRACVSVILDGENCWEYYPENGMEFLDTLYGTLESSKTIQTATFSEVLASAPRSRLPHIPRIVAGSWINSNFRIWVGHPEDNCAWDAVARAKQACDRFEFRMHALAPAVRKRAKEQLERAREELRIAEGSDWCWWYGDDHFSTQKDTFDELFRMHVRAVYAQLDQTVPEDLLHPIQDRPGLAALYLRPSARSSRDTSETPSIAGKLLNESWSAVANSAPAKMFGAMHRSLDHEIEDLKVARVREEVLFRLILSPMPPPESSIQIAFELPAQVVVRLSGHSAQVEAPHVSNPTIRAIWNETVEFALPLRVFSGTKHLSFSIEILSDGNEAVRIPDTGTIECEITEVT